MHKKTFPFPTDDEIYKLHDISTGRLRVVHNKRKRKLRKKGICAYFFPYLGAFLWEPVARDFNYIEKVEVDK